MRGIVLVFGIAGVLGAPVERTFSLASGAHGFAVTIGTSCVAGEGESVEATATVVTVRATPACAAEIEAIAHNWELYSPTDAIVTVTGSPEGLQTQRQRLESRFGRAPNPRLRFLAPTQTCRCLVIAGKRSLEAGQLADGETPAAPGRSPSRNPMAGEGLDPLVPIGSAQDRGLIWHSGSLPQGDRPGPPPLIN